LKDSKIDIVSWILFIVLALIWGSSFILMKKRLQVYSNVQVACLRIIIGGLFFLPVLIINIKKIEWHKLKHFAAIGFIGSFIPAFMFATAQLYLPSGTCGILNSFTPFL